MKQNSFPFTFIFLISKNIFPQKCDLILVSTLYDNNIGDCGGLLVDIKDSIPSKRHGDIEIIDIEST